MRVLIVEGDDALAALLTLHLRREGDTAVVPTAAQAAAAERPDCLLVDVHLPDARGAEAVRAVAAAHPGVPLVALGPDEDVRAGEALIRAGACDHLVIGASRDALVRAVRHAVARGAPRAAVAAGTPEREEALLDGIADLVALATARGRVLWVNAAWSGVLGWTRAEVLALPPGELVHPEDRERVRGELVRAAARGQGRSAHRVRARDGSYRRIEWTVSAGLPDRLCCVGRDVTERDALADALAASEARHREMLASLPDAAVLHYDAELRFRSAGGAALARHGYDAGGMIGRTLADVVPERSLALLEDAYRRALAGEKVQLEHASADGTAAYWTQIVPLRDGAGAVTGGLVVSQDVTGRVLAEAARAAAEARFAGAFEQAPVGMALLDPATGAVVRANPAFLALAGRREAGGFAPRLSMLLAPPDRAETLDAVAAIAAGERAGATLDVRLRRPQGDVWVELRAGLVRDHLGRAEHVLLHVTRSALAEQLAALPEAPAVTA